MPGRARFALVGDKELKKRLAELNPRMEHAVARSLYEEGLNVNTRSKELTPVETGTLKGSTYTSLPERVGPRLVVEIGVGGPAKRYAVYVHEDLTKHHPVGRAKFLETALKEASSGFMERMAKRVRYHFERGSGPPTKQVIDDPNQAPDLRGGR